MRILAAVAALSLSCSVGLQSSVRSSSVDCSTSFAWATGDLVIGSAALFAASRGWSDTPQPGFVPVSEVLAGVFIASAAIGVYKRHNCVRWRETAPPEEWARVAEFHRQEAEADAAAAAANAAALANQPAADPGAGDTAEASCAGGAVAAGDQCVCPDGMSWDGGACALPDPGRPAAPGAPPAPVHRTVTVTRPAQPSPMPQQNVAYHAMFQPSAAAAPSSCQGGLDMVGCSRFCTGYMLQKLRCQCVAGACP